jgi:hypothetical protein
MTLPAAADGRHRRADPALVVHLGFGDLSEATLAADVPVGRSIGQLALWLIEQTMPLQISGTSPDDSVGKLRDRCAVRGPT